MKKRFSILITLIFSMFLLTGCLSASTPEEVVKNHFKDISSELSNDTTKSMLSELVSSKNDNVNEELANALVDALSKIEIKTTGEEINGDAAKVNVSIKGINLQTVISSYITRCMTESSSVKDASEEEITKFAQGLLIDELNKATLEDRTGVINLTKDSDNNWVISQDDDYTTALMGVAASNYE
ncbi:MAG: DUF5105 domain-containing protein [Clostridium sp.]|nr:DUF5105 domain-containing protein [Clostridium sp.]